MSDQKKRPLENQRIDKCNICKWTGPEDDLVEEGTGTKTTWHCPICNSRDIDPWEHNMYDSPDPDDVDPDDDPDDEGSPGRIAPVYGGRGGRGGRIRQSNVN